MNPLPPFLQSVPVPMRLPETASLDEGESAAISLAWQHRADTLVLIDERAGRAIASALGLPIRGLLEFDLTMAQLEHTGFRIAAPLLQKARQQLGL